MCETVRPLMKAFLGRRGAALILQRLFLRVSGAPVLETLIFATFFPVLRTLSFYSVPEALSLSKKIPTISSLITIPR